MSNSIDYLYPVKAVHGKVQKNSKTYTRTLFGKSHEVYLDNPRTRAKSSDHEKAYRAHFGQMQQEAAEIYRDAERLAPYKELFEHQTEERNAGLTGKRKIYVRLDSFVLACLLMEHPFLE